MLSLKYCKVSLCFRMYFDFTRVYGMIFYMELEVGAIKV